MSDKKARALSDLAFDHPGRKNQLLQDESLSSREQRKAQLYARLFAKAEGKDWEEGTKQDQKEQSRQSKPKSGPNPNAKNVKGETQLMRATMRGQARQVKKLLQRGGDPNEPDNAGWYPIHFAKIPRIIQSLVKAGARLDAAGPDGETALHEAARECNMPRIKALLHFGANRNTKNSKGHSPADVAGVEEAARLIREWDAETDDIVLSNSSDNPSSSDEAPEIRFVNKPVSQGKRQTKQLRDNKQKSVHRRAPARHPSASATDSDQEAELDAVNAMLQASDVEDETYNMSDHQEGSSEEDAYGTYDAAIRDDSAKKRKKAHAGLALNEKKRKMPSGKVGPHPHRGNAPQRQEQREPTASTASTNASASLWDTRDRTSQAGSYSWHGGNSFSSFGAAPVADTTFAGFGGTPSIGLGTTVSLPNSSFSQPTMASNGQRRIPGVVGRTSTIPGAMSRVPGAPSNRVAAESYEDRRPAHRSPVNSTGRLEDTSPYAGSNGDVHFDEQQLIVSSGMDSSFERPAARPAPTHMGPPTIIVEPRSHVVDAGPAASVVLEVVADGQAPLSYQWLQNGAALHDTPEDSNMRWDVVHGSQSPKLRLSQLRSRAWREKEPGALLPVPGLRCRVTNSEGTAMTKLVAVAVRESPIERDYLIRHLFSEYARVAQELNIPSPPGHNISADPADDPVAHELQCAEAEAALNEWHLKHHNDLQSQRLLPPSLKEPPSLPKTAAVRQVTANTMQDASASLSHMASTHSHASSTDRSAASPSNDAQARQRLIELLRQRMLQRSASSAPTSGFGEAAIPDPRTGDVPAGSSTKPKRRVSLQEYQAKKRQDQQVSKPNGAAP